MPPGRWAADGRAVALAQRLHHPPHRRRCRRRCTSHLPACCFVRSTLIGRSHGKHNDIAMDMLADRAYVLFDQKKHAEMKLPHTWAAAAAAVPMRPFV